MKFTAAQIAEVLEGKVDGNPEAEVSDFTKIEEGRPQTITFLHNPKYKHYIYDTQASVCIVNEDFKPEKPVKPTLIRVKNAYSALTQLLAYYDQLKKEKSGFEDPHHIAESAQYGENLYVGAYAYVGENVEIGDNVKIYPHVYLGDNTKIGNNVVLYSSAQVYHECEIGNNCIIHSNAVIGADGFGFAPNEEGVYSKIPQIGNVIIEEDVEVGAATTIDRSTMGSTVIRKGVKLDNHIQIAHNVEVGEHTVIAAQVAVAGSTKIGKHCLIGGQCGIVGHIRIGDRVRIQGQSGVSADVDDDAVLEGSPALPYIRFNKSYIHFKNFPDIVRKLNNLEKKFNDTQ